jgi:hypothetical protein
VDQKSATQKGSAMSDVLPINEDHSNLVKFSEASADYAIIAQKLREATKGAAQNSPKQAPSRMLHIIQRPEVEPWRISTAVSSFMPWKRKLATGNVSDPRTRSSKLVSAARTPMDGQKKKGTGTVEVGAQTAKKDIRLSTITMRWQGLFFGQSRLLISPGFVPANSYSGRIDPESLP